ncbi:hypothetical protein KBY84_15960 [Cyanobium sp. N.Huapi 1H5]|uniref:hypothetical protein n=1 Tax=Cyanobium sp. N.Huapi 1H5 TaxID=2823719 RepID=UPI0020CC9EB7|nr:hypothetical protein [Cyanobium sp. N.Huapi 1H5]MCP9838997.1 hypothetical protein [Cyanobium sp. N.Huapi 1H5]
MLETIQREYLLRMAVEADTTEREEVKELVEQVQSMQNGLPSVKLSSWAIAFLVFFLVLLSRSMLPQESSIYIPKIIVAFVTSDPEGFSELAADPKTLVSLFRLAALILMLLVTLVPVVVIHFRFKRMLFNDPEQLYGVTFRHATVNYVWEQKLSYVSSLYDLEVRLVSALGPCPCREYPLDMALIVIAYAYFGLGSGLLTSILGVLGRSPLFFLVGLLNLSIGVFCISMAIDGIFQRSRLRERTQAISILP